MADESERKRAELKARLVTFLQKIPLFEDLPPSTLRMVLSISTKVSLDKGAALCKKGDQSDAMFILLSGKLSVMGSGSEPIATIEPVSSIGEMGVFTGELRSAVS